MNNYWRMMEQVTMSDRKKEEIMDMLENQGTQKRRMPRAGKLILAAALAVGCVLSIAAGLPAQVYHFIGGGSVTVDPNTNTAYYDRLNAVPPAEVDGSGRLWLTVDDQRLDITDKISEDTPYLYERTDPATGQKGYLMLGGTVDDFGWMEWFQMDGDWFWHAENCMRNQSNSFSVGQAGGVSIGTGAVATEDPAPAASGDVGYTTQSEYTVDDTVPYTIDFRPWVQKGIDQLAELGVVACEPQVD